MCFALIALLLVIAPCPEGVADRFSGPLHEGLAEECRTLEAPVAPGLLAASFCYRRAARELLEFSGGCRAFPLFAEGDEEARSEDRASARKGLEQGEVGMVLGALRDGVVAVLDNVQGDTELASEGLHKQRMGAMMPSSVVKGVAALMASMRWVITSAERTWCSRKKVAKVGRASCTALRVGQRLRKSQNSSVSLS